MTAKNKAANSLPFSILTDLPSAAEWHKRCRQFAAKYPALDKLLTMIEQREVPTVEGKKIKLSERDLSLVHAELMFFLINETKTILSVETGFGKGLATGIITMAHHANDLHGGHVPMQARANRSEDDIGEYLLQSLEIAGFQLMDHESANVLPQMYLQQLNEGLSFIYFNSARQFDEQMMEYFYLNQLLNEGGIMAINTQEKPRQDLVDYIRRDRHDYAVREIDEKLTLVQKPMMSALAMHTPHFRH